MSECARARACVRACVPVCIYISAYCFLFRGRTEVQSGMGTAHHTIPQHTTPHHTIPPSSKQHSSQCIKFTALRNTFLVVNLAGKEAE